MPPKPPAEPAAAAGTDVKSRIFDAASLLFRVRGYEATSLGDIGERVGLTGPALYYYFGSKANLLFEVLRQPLLEQIAVCRAASSGQPPVDALAGYVAALVTFLLGLPYIEEMHGEAYVSIGALAKSLAEEQRDEILALLRGPVDDVRDIVKAGARRGDFREVDPTLTAFAVLGMAENVTWLRPGGRLTPARVAQSYADLAVAMVRRAD